ncbi:MAG: hypothetical protein ACTHNA_13985 [Sphingopyxis terrae]|uniref:hypothetical protein n=1 Tax=Sphingopyxis terrae TaxID=33052 RepID=UPI003F7FB4EC
MATVRTSVEICSGLSDYEAEINVEYLIHPGFKGTYYQPPEEASAEIIAVTIIAEDGTKYPAPWLADMLCDDEEVLSLCLVDEAERYEDAMEQRAEAKREARMLGDD